MSKIYFCFLFFVSVKVLGQNQIIEYGINLTNYTSINNQFKFDSESGSHVYVSLMEILNNSIWIGVSYDQYNSYSSIKNLNDFNYKTNYIGLGFKYEELMFNNLNFNLNVGLQKMLTGKLITNDRIISLIKNEDFKGIIFCPSVGLNYKIFDNRFISTSIGYNYLLGINIENKSLNKVNFNSHQFSILIKY